MNSTKPSSNGQSHTLHQLGKSISCGCIKASSCIELADIRKLDSLLNQCESISCDNLLLLDEIYNYDLCNATKRKYVSTSALHKILPKNSIRRRAHKKVLGIRENDTKIIKLIDNKRPKEQDVIEAVGQLTECCELNNDKCEDFVESCIELSHHFSPAVTINCCDKTIQTSYNDLYGHKEEIDPDKYLSNDVSNKNQIQQTSDKRKKTRRKQCSCRNYENTNICETSLTTLPNININKSNHHPKIIEPTSKGSTSWKGSTPPKKSLLQLKKDKSDDKSPNRRNNRITKQKNMTMDDDECGGMGENFIGYNLDLCHENRVININEKSVEIFPISLNSSFSRSPRGTCTNLHNDKSDTQSQKSKRSKFSPSFISKKLTSRLNSEDDGAGGVKESLLGRSKSSEKKLPEPVETVSQ